MRNDINKIDFKSLFKNKHMMQKIKMTMSLSRKELEMLAKDGKEQFDEPVTSIGGSISRNL